MSAPPRPDVDDVTLPLFSPARDRETQLMLKYEEQRRLSSFPSGAFTAAQGEMQPTDKNDPWPRYQLHPLLTLDEIRLLTHQPVFEIRAYTLPAGQTDEKYRLTWSDCRKRLEVVKKFCQRNGIHFDPETHKEKKGDYPGQYPGGIHLSARHGPLVKYLETHELAASHPLANMRPIPLRIGFEHGDDPIKGFPYKGHLIVQSRQKKEPWRHFTAQTDWKKSDLECRPAKIDWALIEQLTMVGQLMLGQDSYLTHSMQTSYAIELSSNLFMLDAYKRLGGTPGQIAALEAMHTLNTAANPLETSSYESIINWHMPALLSGNAGLTRWPLYRTAAAVTELQYVAASRLMKQHIKYDPRTLNSMLKETYLRLHEIPPYSNDHSYYYKDVNTTFNKVARWKYPSPAEQRTITAFNRMARTHTEFRQPRYNKARIRGILSSYHHLWHDKTLLSDDAFLILGLTLEAAALFRPSLLKHPVRKRSVAHMP